MSDNNKPSPTRFSPENAVLIGLAAFKFLLHSAVNLAGGYGIFRDELYYIACGKHLAFGYVDHPPFVALISALSRTAMGDSLLAIRFFPALAGALTVYLAGLAARQLGGRLFAQIVAALAVIIAPVYLFMSGVLSMNPFDALFWTLAAFLLIRILKTGDKRLWLLLGLTVGLGLQNKISMLFFIFGLCVGLLAANKRKLLLSKWFWAAAAIAALLFLPHILWQMQNDWPTLEFMRNAALFKNKPIPPHRFIFTQSLEAHPLGFLILLLGLYFFLFSRAGKEFRLFGWMYLAIFLVFILTNAKPYYASPIYPLMLTGGGVILESLVRARGLRITLVSLMIAGGAVTAPLTLPFLPVETYIAYAEFIGMKPESSERKEIGKLPQHFADMFGWEELSAKVAEVYRSLPPEQRMKCAIFTWNYGEAGAIDFFGPEYGLPSALCSHNNYWLWGSKDYTGEVMIFLGGGEEDYRDSFEEVVPAAVFTHEYVMPYENNLTIFLCRGFYRPLKEAWPELKHFD